MLTQKCGACRSPFMLSAEVRARFDPTIERWRASLRCRVCNADWTPLARVLSALDHRHGAQTVASVTAPDLWEADGPQ